MAERGAKSNAIREFIAATPEATVPEIIAAMSEKKIDVSKALVSKLKYGTKPKRRGRRKKSKADPMTAVTLESLLQAKGYVTRIGSLETARTALQQFAQLIG